jgi:hypothetical protein
VKALQAIDIGFLVFYMRYKILHSSMTALSQPSTFSSPQHALQLEELVVEVRNAVI